MIRRIEVETGLPYGAFLDRHGIDLRYIPGPRYIGPPLGEGCDLWGVRRRAVSVPTPYGEERYSEVAESPLAGLETREICLHRLASACVRLLGHPGSVPASVRRGGWSVSWATG